MCLFVFLHNVGRHFFPDFQGLYLDRYLGIFFRNFRDFAQIFDKSKLLGVRFHPLHPRLLRHWAHNC